MSPIDTAYAAQAAAIATALASAGFLPAADSLQVDPASANALSGDETEAQTAAALVRLGLSNPRTLMGGPAPRYVVDRTSRLELGVVGPDEAVRDSLLSSALAAVAALPGADPTLGGAAERFFLGELEDGELPPNGAEVFVTFTVRVRSGDPLGQTP